ncbi:MAG: hypothetical protein N3E45_17115 [Oscillatoriaceae bacterium SKW80]|nr:hypothetical protein [Oscillatoriaceae bacterium SKW80]HIK27956.1 hypothetical protein [Oscillatoriaceae cyanobacterium M7585_C2015_266]
MPASIATKDLISRKIRAAVANRGVRTFAAIQSAKRDKDGGILGWLWNAGKIFAGIIGDVFNLLGIGIATLWGLFVSTAQYLWNFDWQITDKSIDEQIQNSFNSLGGPLGGLLGNAVGYLACGAVPGAVVFVFNKPLGVKILKEVGEEAADEFLGNLTNVVRLTFQKATESLILWGFKNVRKFIKSNVDFFGRIFGARTKDAIRAWGNEGNKPWSFAQAVEDRIEKIPNRFIKAFVEEFLEEAWEGCVEAGYVAANAADAYLASQKLQEEETSILGEDRIVEITPNREVPEEKLILAGKEEVLKPAIVNALANHKLLENRDVGVVYSMPADDKQISIRANRPKIILKFSERKTKERLNRNRFTGVISFRLMNEDINTLTDQKIQAYANKIRSKFATPKYPWRKGKLMVSYTDWAKGYSFQLLVVNKAEGRRLIERVLDIQGHSPEWEYMNVINTESAEKAFPDVSKTRTVLGKQVKTKVRRPNVVVEFDHACLKLADVAEPIALVDTTNRYFNALFRVSNSTNVK